MTAFWDAVASAGPYANNMHLAPDRQQHQHHITQLLQAGCSSWCPTNSVRANGRQNPTDLNDCSRRHFAHVLYGILVAKPVRAFHRVVEMPLPLVILGVAKSRIHSTLAPPASLRMCRSSSPNSNVVGIRQF